MGRDGTKPRRRRQGVRVDLWIRSEVATLIRREAKRRGQGLTVVITSILTDWRRYKRRENGDLWRRGMREDLMLLQAAEQQLRTGANGAERDELRRQAADAVQRMLSRISQVTEA